MSEFLTVERLRAVMEEFMAAHPPQSEESKKLERDINHVLADPEGYFLAHDEKDAAAMAWTKREVRINRWLPKGTILGVSPRGIREAEKQLYERTIFNYGPPSTVAPASPPETP